MEIERLIYNNNGYFYGLYTLIRKGHSYKWMYVSGSMSLDEQNRRKYMSIYIKEPDGCLINFKEHHLYEDTAPNL